MGGFRRALHQLHRRSIWQILAIYLAGSWIVLQVADQLTESAGLPDWVPAFALVLLLIGLPIVIATAFVQRGLPGGNSRSGGERAWDEPTGRPPAGGAWTGERAGGEPAGQRAGGDHPRAGTPADLPAPASPRAAGSRLFTWRNAMIGGAAAFAIQGIAVGGYFAMRTLGIGPVASLVAQGVLDERDPVVLADFEDRSDGSIGDLVTEALRVDLVESRVLALAPPARVQQVLERMGRATDTTLTPALAREVAQRAPFKAVIQGDVTPAGEGYVLTASVVAAESGDILAAFRESASRSDDLIRAVDKLSERIREKLGEELREIRAGEPLEQVTTSSLDALRKYTDAVKLMSRGEYRPAIGLLEEATQIDTAFAMAYRKLGVAMSNFGGFTGPRRREVATRAHEHRDRLSEVERYLTIAWYHEVVTADWDASIQAYQNVLRIDPHELTALNNLANRYQVMDRYEDAAPLLETALELVPVGVVFSNLIENYLMMRDTAKAIALVERFEQEFPDGYQPVSARLNVEVHRGDPARIHEAAERISAHEAAPIGRRATGVAGGSYADRAAGKWREAREHMREAGRFAELNRARTSALAWSLAEAENAMGLAQDTAGARSLMREVLASGAFDALAPVSRPWVRLISDLGWLGMVDEGRTYYARWETELAEADRPPTYDGQRRDAAIWLGIGSTDPETAIRAIRELQVERRCQRCYRFWLAELEAERGAVAEAIALYEKVVEEPDGILTYPMFRVLALERLGPLYEQVGDFAKAAAVYAEFAERWKDADAELRARGERAGPAAGRRARELNATRESGRAPRT